MVADAPPARISPGAASGRVQVPGSKSHTHRAYVLAARSDTPVAVRGPLRAADPDATLAALHAMGARIQPGERDVAFQPAVPVPPPGVLDLRNAGTGLRLLTAQAATLAGRTGFTGDASLRSRPNLPLLDALRQLGARVDAPPDGRCPYTVQGPIRGGPVQVSGGTSSQFTSALMLALPLVEGDSLLHLAPPVRSRPYLDVTLHAARAFGLRLEAQVDGSDVYRIPGGQVPRCSAYTVPGDWSTAAFPLAAGALAGGPVEVAGLDAQDPQGDRAIAAILASFGARVERTPSGVAVAGQDLASPGHIDVAATPDLFPVLCAVAAVARGTTTFTGGDGLRHKECDRIEAMAHGLAAMGIEARQRPDGLIVTGGKPQGATLSCRHDHRIHMALSVLALAAEDPTRIDDPGCVAVSYPGFHADLRRLQEAAA